MNALEIGALRKAGEAFAPELAAAKRRAQGRFEWYPYQSLSNLVHLDRLLTGERRNLAPLIGSSRVLDVGCADGELSFFLESQGLEVTAIDHPRSNHSGLAGLRALRAELKSPLEVIETDLDAQFELASRHFGLGFLLGALYHLKNPIYVLETLSRHLQYCFLSTRILRYLPGENNNAARQPIAYLLDATELNRDNSNYWIFSEAGLRRLLVRSNWRVLDYLAVGNERSDPVSERDQRAYCLLQSTYALADVQRLTGWHEPEAEGWRWTERKFDAELTPVQSGTPMLWLRLFVPDALVDRFGAIELKVAANGVELRPETYRSSGEFQLERRIDSKGPVHLAFTLSHALPPDEDPRERGIIVAGLRLE